MDNLESFILDSPPGQVSDVYNDIHAIIGTTAELSSIIKHNISNQISLELPDQDYKLIICSESLQEESGNCFDPRSGSFYKVDHLHLTCELDDQPKITSSKERNNVDKSVQEYVAKYYHDASCAVFEIDQGYRVYISGQKFNPKSFWAGSWKSAWLFTNSFEIKGTVSARVHYYEDGNVQLNSTKEFKGKKNNLNGCIEFVLLCEKEFQTSLGTFFIQNAVDVFKNLRRALPITKSKIEWPAILSYKIGEELNK